MMRSRRKPLERRIAERIARRRTDVFLRGDFMDLVDGPGAYDQVGRALRRLVEKERLVRIGYGLYARAARSPLSGKNLPTKPLPSIAAEALRRLNVEVAASGSRQAYDAGETTQVPTGRVIAVKDRISRKIGYDGAYVTLERAA